MNTTQSLLEGVIVMLAIISIIVLLKKLAVLKKEDSLLFSRIVLQITLPAVIFSSLAVREFDNRFLIMAAIMGGVEITMMLLAWTVATLLKFKKAEKGALILVSAFGMTTMLGYPIIQQVFPGSAQAMEEAVVTSEFGVGLLLFIFGPLIAMYYGDSEMEGKAITQSVKKFFLSPIFFSLVAGIGVSFLKIDHSNQMFSVFLRIFKLIGSANLLMVAITIGLIIELKFTHTVFLFVGLAIVMKLIIKPLLAYWLCTGNDLTEMMRQVVFIETELKKYLQDTKYGSKIK